MAIVVRKEDPVRNLPFAHCRICRYFVLVLSARRTGTYHVEGLLALPQNALNRVCRDSGTAVCGGFELKVLRNSLQMDVDGG